MSRSKVSISKGKSSSNRMFLSKYPDWSEKISSFMPRLNFSPDTCQLYANFMIIVAVFGVTPLAIQILRVYRTKETKGISIYAFMFQILISSLWFCYALICGNGIIIISSTLIVIAAFLLVFFTWRYSRRNSNENQ